MIGEFVGSIRTFELPPYSIEVNTDTLESPIEAFAGLEGENDVSAFFALENYERLFRVIGSRISSPLRHF